MNPIIPLFVISQFILTENEFICGVREEFYLVSVSQNTIQDTIQKIEGIGNQKIKDSVWKLIYEDQDEFEVVYKDGRREKVRLRKKCFIKGQSKEPEINLSSPDIIEMIFDVSPSAEIKAEAYYGKIIEIKPLENKIKVKYKRFVGTPYEDIIFLTSVERDFYGNEKLIYSYNKLRFPGKVVFRGETTEPESYGEIRIGKRVIKFKSDKEGKFSVTFDVQPLEEKFKVIIRDKAGNETEEEISIPEYYTFEEPRFEAIMNVGKKLVFIVEDKSKLGRIRVMKGDFSDDYQILEIDKNSVAIIPGFGEYDVFVRGKIMKIQRGRIPYNISVYPEKSIVEATGNDKVKLNVQIKDIIGKMVRVDKAPIKPTATFGKVKREDQYFVFWAENMPDEVSTYNVEVKFDVQFTPDDEGGGKEKSIFLSASTYVILTPGKPSYIYAEIQDNKSFIEGNGLDEAIIRAKVKDKAGNTVFLKSPDEFSILPSAGEIKVLNRSEREIKFAIRHESELDDTIKITLEYGQLSETLNIRVIGTRVVYDANWELGAGTNFGVVALRTGPNLELKYSVGGQKLILGAKLQTLAKFGNIKIYSLLPGVSFGWQIRLTDKFSIKAKNSFILNLSQIEFEKIKENTAIFGTEPSISLTFGKSFPIFSVSISYLLNLTKMSETQFFEFSIKDLNFIFIQAGVSYAF
jgi:hypothetical protein